MTGQEYIFSFKKRHGRLPSQAELSKALKIAPQQAISLLLAVANGAPKKSKQAVATKNPTLKYLWFLVIGLLLISAMTFVLSVYFTRLWFLGMFGSFIATTISVSMVSYMVLSPQAVGFIKGVVKVPLWATFAIALTFSMGSTVAGQYNKLTESVDIVEVNDRATLEDLRKYEAELEESIRLDRVAQRSHQQTMEQLSATEEMRKENSAYIRTERNMVSGYEQSISEYQDKLSTVREEIAAERESGNIGETQEREDFYKWLAGQFDAERSRVEFAVSVLPAVFIDIIAALSLNVALALIRRIYDQG